MTNLKQSLPRRIISLLLAVAMMIGFVPHINLDLTAFAETGGIELDDAKPQSGANWVWDNTTHTLSLYNAYINPTTTTYYAFKYTGSSTLKIDQIGYNLIDNGYIEADKIEVVGSGILDIQNLSSDKQMFKTKELTLSNGYITSSGTASVAATKLVYNEEGSSGNSLVKNVTISNCVLDIPYTTITAQTTSTEPAFIMNSGYVRCDTFETKRGTTEQTASINGGYLEANTIRGDGNGTDGYAYIDLVNGGGAAVIKADTLGTNTSFGGTDSGCSTLGSAILIYETDSRGLADGGLCASEETLSTDSAGYTVRMRTETSSQYIPLGRTAPTSFSANTAYYFDSDATLALDSGDELIIPKSATVVCNGELTLNNVTVGGTDTSCATVYAKEKIKSNLSGIYGCVVCENAELFNQTEIRVSGGLYLTGSLTLNDNTTIGANAAVTMYSKAATSNILNCSNNTLSILGDFSIKKSDSNTGTIFNDTEQNIVLGSDGQLAAVGSWSTSSNTIFYPLVGNPYNTIVSSALANNRYVYTASQIYDDMDCNYLFEKPNVIYIGDEYKPQIVRTKTDIYNHDKENIVFQKSLGDEAYFEFICSREITADDISVKVLNGTNDKTDIFTIEKEVSSSNSRIVTVKLKLNEDLDYSAYTSLDVKVALNASGAELYSTIAQLEVTPLNFALDFTLDEDDTRWDYFGEFLGTNTACKADPDDDGDSVWEWYPTATEDYAAKTLVLKSLKFKTTANNAIIVPAGTTIVIHDPYNRIQSKLTAIVSKGDVTIVGDGDAILDSQLAVRSDHAGKYTENHQHTYGAGLYAQNGNVTIKNCWIQVEAGNFLNDGGYSLSGDDHCYGISGKNVTFVNAEAKITAGKAIDQNEYVPNYNSAAVYASDRIIIKGTSKLTLNSYNYALQANDGNIEILDNLRTVTNAYEEEARTTPITTAYDWVENQLKVFYTKTADDPTDATTIETNADKVSVTVYSEGFTTKTWQVNKYADFTKSFEAPEGSYISSFMYGIGEADVNALLNDSNEITHTVYNGINLTGVTFKLKALESDYGVEIGHSAIAPTVTVTNTDGNLDSTAIWNASTNEYIDVEPNMACRYNELLRLCLTAKDGYYIKTLIVDGVSLITNGTQNLTADTSEIEATLEGFGEHIDGGLIVSADISYDDEAGRGITRNSDITVECAPLSKHTLTITGTGEGGTVNDEQNNPFAAGTQLTEGSTVRATVTPNDGYELTSVTVNGIPATPNENNVIEFVVTDDTTINAVFTKLRYTLTVTANNAALGTFTSDKTITAGAVTEEHGTAVKLVFQANDGYYISKLTVDGKDLIAGETGSQASPLNSAECESANGKNTKVTVNFESLGSSSTVNVEYTAIPTYTVTVTTPANGTVTLTPSGSSFREYTQITAAAAPNSGYVIASVKINGTAISFNADNTFSFAVSDNTTVEVTFTNVVHTVTVNTPANGTVTFEPDISNGVAEGATVTATATPNNGYQISTVKVNGTTVTPDSNGKFSFTVNANTTVEVTFTNVIHTVTVNTPANGTVTFEPDISNGVAEGATVTATATPNNGYQISSVKVNGTTVTPDSNGKFRFTVTENTTLEVTFTRTPSGGSANGNTSGLLHGSDMLPALDGTGYSYDLMAKVLAAYKAGSTATIEVNGNYDIPVEVIEAIKNGGLKVTVVINSVVSRYIDGTEVKNAKAIDVRSIRTHQLTTKELRGEEGVQLILKDVDIHTDLVLSFDAKNAGLFANIYKCTDEDKNEFKFTACAKIDKDGKAVFEGFATKGTYVVMLSEYSSLPGDMDNDGKLTAADSSAILKYLVGFEDKRKNELMGDYSGDGVITAHDASLILKALVASN